MEMTYLPTQQPRDPAALNVLCGPTPALRRVGAWHVLRALLSRPEISARSISAMCLEVGLPASRCTTLVDALYGVPALWTMDGTTVRRSAILEPLATGLPIMVPPLPKVRVAASVYRTLTSLTLATGGSMEWCAVDVRDLVCDVGTPQGALLWLVEYGVVEARSVDLHTVLVRVLPERSSARDRSGSHTTESAPD